MLYEVITADRLANIVVDAAAVTHGIHNGGKVVVHQNQVGGLAADLAAPLAHSDADIGIVITSYSIHYTKLYD